ncbi:aminoglycoside phosphotransferase family protein [Negadavirga shengliensis]|uniref:Aminoglycoside phosphotransferase family protein n=1 Tax=Negadavirga shengliensis TaxID=1389218 RepID=A0ABV9T1X5_9BACT
MDEINGSLDVAQNLLKDQFLNWAEIPLKPINSSGSDNFLYRLGKDLIIRIPRHQAAAHQLKKECFWLEKIHKYSPIAIPEPVSIGRPNEYYPFYWSIYRWIEGETYSVDKFSNSEKAVESLVQFISYLQRIDIKGGPKPSKENNFRGVPLMIRDLKTREAINALPDFYSKTLMTEIWNFALTAPAWNKRPVWIHGDLHWGNILTKGDKIVGVIDFGCLGVGDPANDIMSAWVLFSPLARQKFREMLQIDKGTWIRGMGWALSWAAVALPYYLPKHHILADIAVFTIDNVITDYQKNVFA